MAEEINIKDAERAKLRKEAAECYAKIEIAGNECFEALGETFDEYKFNAFEVVGTLASTVSKFCKQIDEQLGNPKGHALELLNKLVKLDEINK